MFPKIDPKNYSEQATMTYFAREVVFNIRIINANLEGINMNQSN